MEVVLRRVIAEGNRFHISPSMGFEGIESGVVEVVAIKHYEELVTEDPNVESLVELDATLVDVLWVLYHYTYCPDMHDDDLEYVMPMPLELFAEHISAL